jgi:proteasome lid subunit RPN8/RPN11
VVRVVTIRLSEALVEGIRREGELAYPAECCGVLGGRIAGANKEVSRLAPMVNRRTDDPRRYLISPEDLLRTTADLRQASLEVLGYYHSHPDHPAAPSEFDSANAWPWYSYIIVRVEQGRAAELTSWVLEEDCSAMRQESLEVLSEV